MGGIFKSIGKIAKIALPVALSYATGGTSAALMAAGSSFASAALSPKAPKASAITGQVQSAADASASATPTESAAEIEKKKRLALNAAGSSGTSTSPLGVTSKANVTKRNLLGL